MADSNKVDINFSAETNKASGDVKKFKGEIEAIGPSGKKAAASISGSFKTIESSIGKLKKALGALSFGSMMVESVVNLVNQFRAWREEVRKAAVETQKLKNAAKFDEQTRGVEALSERYRKLTTDIQSAATAAQGAERAATAAMDAQRQQEDAQLALKEEQEVAALDRNDPTYSEKVRQIRQRYAGARATLGAGRAVEDAEAKLRGYKDEEFNEDVRADTYARSATDARAEAGEMRRQAELWRRMEAIGSAKSGEDWMDRWFRNPESNKMVASFFKNGGDRSFMDAVKGMTPEEIAAYAREQAAKFDAKAAKAESSATAFEGKASEAAAKSKAAGALVGSQGVVVSAARTRQSAAALSTQTAQGDADAALARGEENARARAEEERRKAEEDRAKREAEEVKRASALAAVGNLSGQRDAILAQIAEQQSLKSGASQRVFEAQNALDLATANGNRAGIGTAASALADAKTNAQNVGAAADRVLADLSASLKNIEQRLNAASNYLKQQNSQSTYAWAEAPAGD